MGVTVDSSVLIDILSGDRKALAVVKGLEAEGLLPVLSAVAVFEILSGVEFSKSRSERAKVELLLRQIPIEPFDLDGTRRAGELRAELQRTGRSPGASDVMIAGHAVASGHTLVTRDRSLSEAASSLGLRVVTL